MTSELAQVSVAIPTFGRDRVLIETVEHLLAQSPAAAEIIVADQTPQHDSATEAALAKLAAEAKIKLLRLERPSITGSMNAALREAKGPVVLFVDDDITPKPNLIGAHAAAYGDDDEMWAVVGQVLQPGQEPASSPVPGTDKGLRAHLDFCFYSTSCAWVKSVMAGNLSVRRVRALEIGGFDENFVGVAYRFETEFCRRIWDHGGKVLYEPSASIRHLRVSAGGTRRYGCHLCSPSPAHGVGDYYFALRQGRGLERMTYALKRPVREVCTRYHLKHPWCIPVKLVGELAAAFWAMGLWLRGPRLMRSGERGYGSGSGRETVAGS